jgi:predicted nucleic acid-binding protein
VSVVVDSWAVLSWLDGEQPAARVVQNAISDQPVISWVNLVEVLYRVERKHGRDVSERYLRDLRGPLLYDLPLERRMVEAARVKAIHPIALADCFAVATAEAYDAELYTGDPEIIALDRPRLRVRDLR